MKAAVKAVFCEMFSLRSSIFNYLGISSSTQKRIFSLFLSCHVNPFLQRRTTSVTRDLYWLSSKLRFPFPFFLTHEPFLSRHGGQLLHFTIEMIITFLTELLPPQFATSKMLIDAGGKERNVFRLRFMPKKKRQ